jgi:catechol 2,3-dioxygenase-like lactoylglutathione lyase family enzyme
MSLTAVFQEYEVLVRVDVTNQDASIAWYKEKLDLELNKKYFVKDYWAQVYSNELPRFQIGLNSSPPTKAAHEGPTKEPKYEVTTFVVSDIKQAVANLRAKGVVVTDPQPQGEGVLLSYFDDPDHNHFAIRENT